MSKGLIHVYTGDGKGKTTAAFGLAMRAAGQGRKVLVLQFLKSGMHAGEIRSAKKAGIKVVQFRKQTTPLFDPTVKRSELRKTISADIAFSLEKIRKGRFDMIIMEEFNNVIGGGYAAVSAVKKILKAKPEALELVFTGRSAPAELIAAADYVTEMRMIKHPARSGVMARKGIEY